MTSNNTVEIANTEWGKAAYISSADIQASMKYVKENNITGIIISFDKGYKFNTIDFLKEYNFIERLTISTYKEIDYSGIHYLNNLKVLAINVLGKDNQEIDFTKFSKLEDCRFTWRPKAKTIFACSSLKRLDIINFKRDNLIDLQNLTKLKNLKIRQSTIKSLNGIEFLKLETFGLFHLSKLESLTCIEGLAKTLINLEIESCKSINEINEIGHLINLEKLGINNCGEISSIKPIRGLNKLIQFDFWESTNIVDGDMTPCIGIKKVAYQNRKHYTHTNEEIDAINR